MRRALACVALLTLLAAPPALLLLLGFTDWGAIHLWSASDVRVLLAALTVVGWLAWALWVVSVVAELAAALSRGRVRIAIPGLAAPRALASTLIAMTVAAASPSTLALASPAPPSAHAAPASPVPDASTAAAAAASDAGTATTPLAVVATAPAGHRHAVRAGDDLWSLASHHYGDGTQWRRIVAANPSLQGDPLAPLSAGIVLDIPAPVTLVTVVQGDTLSGLALEHLGDAARWPEIHALNPDRVPNPHLIRPGWVLKVPAAVAGGPADSSGAAGVPGQAALTSVGDAALTPAGGAALTPAGDAATPASPSSTPGVTAVPVDEFVRAEPPADRLAGGADATAPAAALVGGMASVAAGAVLGGIGLRRHVQAQARPLGRRYAPPTDELARYESALTQVAHTPAGDGEPTHDRPPLLARAMRRLASHWWQEQEPGPVLRQAVLGPDDVTFELASPPPTVPPGFTRIDAGLVVSWHALAGWEDVDHPVAFPALVTLGEAEDGRLVMIDVLASGVLGICAADGHGARDVLNGMLVELACAPWAEELTLLVVTDDPAFADVASEGRVLCEPDVDDGVAAVERMVRQRSRFMAGPGWQRGRLDPDLADAWCAQVVLFEVAPDADQLARLESAIASDPCGVAAIAQVGPEASAHADWTLDTDGAGARSVTTDGSRVAPQSVPDATRAALTSLYELASTTASEEAPWWTPPTEDDVNIIALRPAPVAETPAGPRLNLLGPVELVGCAGEAPTRAARQCMEYCAWLMLHPGSTPVQMADALVVAEGTRRSNMSRLRRWLGSRPDGTPYLPDAYSGRIVLHSDVGSDWDDLATLTGGGVNRLPLGRLVAALELVRGAPLADAAPGQWGWAEGLRADASALIRDVGVVAARAARARGDLETARWAANRALLAAPDDELLLVERIRTEHAAGRLDEVRRLVQKVTRTARMLDVELLPETVFACQEALEGRRRARV